MMFKHLQLPIPKMKQKYKIFNIDGIIKTFYYNDDSELIFYKLHQDCLKYKFCPICTNKIEFLFGHSEYYYACTLCKFTIYADLLTFNINTKHYYFYTDFNYVQTDDAYQICWYSDLIPNENTSLIDIYNNLNKILIFK